MIKESNTKFTKDKNEHCFVIDRFTKVMPVAEDPKIPGSTLIEEQSLVNLYFKSLESIADSKGNEVINYIGVILRLGGVGTITLKNGE